MARSKKPKKLHVQLVDLRRFPVEVIDQYLKSEDVFPEVDELDVDSYSIEDIKEIESL